MMALSRDLRQWRAVTRSDRVLLVEAALAVSRAALAIRFLPFRRVVASSAAMPLGEGHSTPPAKLAWAVEAAARRMPYRAKCFQQGLALQAMLRRRGFPARLHYGVGNDATGLLAAHVWISLDGLVLLGGDEAPRFRELAAYP